MEQYNSITEMVLGITFIVVSMYLSFWIFDFIDKSTNEQKIYYWAINGEMCFMFNVLLVAPLSPGNFEFIIQNNKNNKEL